MSDKKLTVKAVLFGTVCGLLITIILLCILSAVVLTSGLLPEELTNIITVILLGMGVFCGGFISSRITKSAGLIVGLITGFTVFLLVTIIGLTRSNESVTYITLIRLIATLIAGALGGIIGVNKKEKIHIK